MADQEIEAIRALLLARPRPDELSERRKRLDDLGTQYKIPTDVHIESVEANGVRAEWSSTPDAEPACVILFLHGGGYVSGSLDSHRPLATEIGRVCGARTLALGYRLAPEYPFPAALEDALAGYRFLLSSGIDPRHIAVAGDSAGGGLTVALMVSARDAGLPQPVCGWCISPWVDLECLGESMTSKAEVDPIDPETLFEGAGCSLSQRRRSPHAAGFANLRRSQRIGATPDSGGFGGDTARRRGPSRQCRWGRRRGGYTGDMARHDSCMATVSSASHSRAACDRPRRSVHPL